MFQWNILANLRLWWVRTNPVSVLIIPHRYPRILRGYRFIVWSSATNTNMSHGPHRFWCNWWWRTPVCPWWCFYFSIGVFNLIIDSWFHRLWFLYKFWWLIFWCRKIWACSSSWWIPCSVSSILCHLVDSRTFFKDCNQLGQEKVSISKMYRFLTVSVNKRVVSFTLSNLSNHNIL